MVFLTILCGTKQLFVIQNFSLAGPHMRATKYCRHILPMMSMKMMMMMMMTGLIVVVTSMIMMMVTKVRTVRL